MKTLATQRRLAAEILGVGKSRVRFDPERLGDIREALTKADIEELVKDKAIKAKPAVKRIKRKEKGKRKKKRRRKTGGIRMKVKKRKQLYVKKIRKLRKYLKFLKLNAMITTQEYHNLRLLAKTGQFKSKRHLQEYVQDILKKVKKPEKLKEEKEKPKEKSKKSKSDKKEK